MISGGAMALLEIENLSVSFGGKRVLNGASWNVAQGECVGVVGESGSGKSLTALSMLGLLPKNARVESGSIRFEGQELLELDEDQWCQLRGNKMAMGFQELSTCLNPVMRIGDQISEVLTLHRGLDRVAATEEAVSLLDRVGISQPQSRIRQYPHHFSGGMRQRVMIATAMACKPKLLIADEPTTALDVTVQAQILKLLKALTRDLGISLVMISHDLGVIYSMADTVVVMRDGEVLEQGARDQIYSDPKHPYTLELMQSYLSWAGAA
jgi:ABC-type dipeptide/oligopeptide/nickel transport system ATPase component